MIAWQGFEHDKPKSGSIEQTTISWILAWFLRKICAWLRRVVRRAWDPLSLFREKERESDYSIQQQYLENSRCHRGLWLLWDASARAPSPLTEPRVLVRPNAILSSMIATREASNPIRVKCRFTAAWRIENCSWEDRRDSFFLHPPPPYFFLIDKQIRESLTHLCLGKLVRLPFTVGLSILS